MPFRCRLYPGFFLILPLILYRIQRKDFIVTAHYGEEIKLIIQTLLDLFLHLDKNMGTVIQSYGMWTYLILFAIIFAETGFVITPFLPGDSLLFVAGAFAASGALSLPVRNNFTIVIFAIIFISILPGIIGFARGKRS